MEKVTQIASYLYQEMKDLEERQKLFFENLNPDTEER